MEEEEEEVLGHDEAADQDDVREFVGVYGQEDQYRQANREHAPAG
jgi:hypothetical protein